MKKESHPKIVDKSLEISKDLFPVVYSNKKKYGCFHFAFIYRRNTLLSIGQNSYEPNNKALALANRFGLNKIKKHPYLHAEMSAISKIWGREYIDNTMKMVVIRLNKNFELQNSKPCKSCSTVIKALGVERIWYSTVKGIEYGL